MAETHNSTHSAAEAQSVSTPPLSEAAHEAEPSAAITTQPQSQHFGPSALPAEIIDMIVMYYVWSVEGTGDSSQPLAYVLSRSSKGVGRRAPWQTDSYLMRPRQQTVLALLHACSASRTAISKALNAHLQFEPSELYIVDSDQCSRRTGDMRARLEPLVAAALRWYMMDPAYQARVPLRLPSTDDQSPFIIDNTPVFAMTLELYVADQSNRTYSRTFTTGRHVSIHATGGGSWQKQGYVYVPDKGKKKGQPPPSEPTPLTLGDVCSALGDIITNAMPSPHQLTPYYRVLAWSRDRSAMDVQVQVKLPGLRVKGSHQRARFCWRLEDDDTYFHCHSDHYIERRHTR